MKVTVHSAVHVTKDLELKAGTVLEGDKAAAFLDACGPSVASLVKDNVVSIEEGKSKSKDPAEADAEKAAKAAEAEAAKVDKKAKADAEKAAKAKG